MARHDGYGVSPSPWRRALNCCGGNSREPTAAARCAALLAFIRYPYALGRAAVLLDGIQIRRQGSDMRGSELANRQATALSRRSVAANIGPENRCDGTSN